MKNEYEIRGDVTAIIINSRKYGRHEALISTIKLNRAKGISGGWCVKYDKTIRSFYVMGNTKTETGKQKIFYLHRWITHASSEMEVDHKDHDPLNNTESNLKIVTHAENKQNLKGAQANSTSGIRGVSWHKTINKWRVRIMINQVSKHIGDFANFEEAKQASIEARFKYMPFSNESLL